MYITVHRKNLCYFMKWLFYDIFVSVVTVHQPVMAGEMGEHVRERGAGREVIVY